MKQNNKTENNVPAPDEGTDERYEKTVAFLRDSNIIHSKKEIGEAFSKQTPRLELIIEKEIRKGKSPDQIKRKQPEVYFEKRVEVEGED